MAESLAKTPYCSKCGEDARPQALFCFACGGKVIDPALLNEEGVSKSWFKEDLAADKPIPMPAVGSDEPIADSETGEKSEAVDAEKETEKSSDKKLTSAKELRNRPKPVQTKKVEVVWQEKTDSRNVLFVVFGLLAAVVTAFLFVMSIYLS